MENVRDGILIQTAPVLKLFINSKPTNMNSEQIMKSDVLDILFEKRNKLYGAYVLRKFYNDRLLKSLIIMLSLAAVLSAFTLLPDKKFINTSGVYVIDDVKTGKVAETKPIIPDLQPKLKTVITPASAKPTVNFTNNIVITKNNITTTLPVDLDDAQIGTTTIPGVPGGGTLGKDSGTVFHVSTPSTQPVVDVTAPMLVAEVMPSFPGGDEGLRRFLQNNLVNPETMDEGESVSVKVRFVVGFDGKPKSFTIIQNGGEEFNNEVIRVLKKMPQWIPGKSNGQNVSVYTTIPVKFVGSN